MGFKIPVQLTESTGANYIISMAVVKDSISSHCDPINPCMF